MKFKTTLFIVILSVIAFNTSDAQKIIQFSQYKILKTSSNTKIKIQPHTRSTRVGEDESRYDRFSGVYGVLICYTVDGEKKVKRQDMSGDLKRKGYYENTLAYGSKARVSNVSVTYFNMVDEPRSEWPKKEDCF